MQRIVYVEQWCSKELIMKTKLTVITIALIALVWCGLAIGRWANAESQATEARWNEALSVLGQK